MSFWHIAGLGSVLVQGVHGFWSEVLGKILFILYWPHSPGCNWIPEGFNWEMLPVIHRCPIQGQHGPCQLSPTSSNKIRFILSKGITHLCGTGKGSNFLQHIVNLQQMSTIERRGTLNKNQLQIEKVVWTPHLTLGIFISCMTQFCYKALCLVVQASLLQEVLLWTQVPTYLLRNAARKSPWRLEVGVAGKSLTDTISAQSVPW